MTSKSISTVSSLEGVHDLRLGKSFQLFLDNSANPTSFHTFRYDFKPASIDLESAGQVTMGEQGEHHVSVVLPHVADSHCVSTIFNGNQRTVDKECVLIVDKQTGKMTLELISSAVNLKRVRDEPRENIAPSNSMSNVNINVQKPVVNDVTTTSRENSNKSSNSRFDRINHQSKPVSQSQVKRAPAVPVSSALGLSLSEDDDEEEKITTQPPQQMQFKPMKTNNMMFEKKPVMMDKQIKKSPISQNLSSSSDEELIDQKPIKKSKTNYSKETLSRPVGPGSRPFYTEEQHKTFIQPKSALSSESGSISSSDKSVSDLSSDDDDEEEDEEEINKHEINYSNNKINPSSFIPDKRSQFTDSHYSMATTKDLLNEDLMLSEDDDDDDDL